MKIAPLKVSDPWYGRIVNDSTVDTDSLSGVPIESTVDVELVELLHAGPETNYRPFLHLRGELTEAVPSVELPYGVTEVVLRRGSGEVVDAFYDFTPEQLSTLVAKGYFSEAFRVPDEMTGIPWTLPGKADFLVVAPQLSDQPPLVFMNVHDQTNLALSQASSGYELAGYFPDYSAQAQAEAEAEVAAQQEQHSGQPDARTPEGFQDVFSGVAFEEHRPTVDAPISPSESDYRAIVPDGVFSRLVSEIQAHEPAEAQQDEEVEAEEAAVVAPSSAWETYMARVSPGVEAVLAGEHVSRVAEDEHADPEGDAIVPEVPGLELGETTPDGFIDFSAAEPEPELVPLSQQVSEATEEDHRRVAERRSARLRAQALDDGAPADGDEAQPAI